MKVEPPTSNAGGVKMKATGRVVRIVLVTAIISALIGLTAGIFVRSPAQLAADAAPPEKTPLTTAVTEGELEQPLILPGVVTLGDVVELTPSNTGIVTGLPLSVGQQFSAGSVLVEVNDRPVIFLQGEIPLLRDLGPGDRGEDVTRLQRALAPWATGTPDGIWGAGTTEALKALYRSAGYATPGGNAALRSELVFGPAAEGTILSVKSALGTSVEAPLIRATTSPPTVTSNVPDATSQLLAIDQRVRISGTSIGGEKEGSITQIGGLTTGEDGVSRATVVITPDEALRAGSVEGKVEIAVSVQEDSSSGLLVPLSAIHSDAHGGNYVVVLVDGAENHVEVVVEQTGAGQALVSPSNEDLVAGDLVIVGVT